MDKHTILLTTHLTFIYIFFISILSKTILLIINKHLLFYNLRQKTKPFEKYLGPLMILTGLLLIPSWQNIPTWIYVKLTVVALMIPLAIIGLKKANKVLTIISVIGFLYAFGIAYTKQIDIGLNKGNENNNPPHVFTEQCADCHGNNGNGGIYPLTNKPLSTEEIKNILGKGRGNMPSFDQLPKTQVDSLVIYIQKISKK